MVGLHGDFALYASVLGAVVVLSGCGDGGRKAPLPGEWAPTLKNPQVLEIRDSGEQKGVEELEQDDIVVAVNGVALTRREIDTRLRQRLWMAARDRKTQPRDKAAAYRMFGKTLIDKWIDTQVLVWESRRLGCADEAAIREGVQRGLENFSTFYKMPFDALDEQFPGGLDALRRDFEDMVWTSAYITNNVKAEVTVDDAMVERVKADIRAENAVIAASNAVKMAQMRKIRAEALRPGADFGLLADRYSEDVMLVKDGTGRWGDFKPSEFEDASVRKRIFELDRGQISEIIDDNESYMIVKVVEISEGTREPGDNEATFTLARIALDHEQLNVLANEGDLKKDLEGQFFGKSLAARKKQLRAEAKIVYPYGTDFWNARKRREAKAAKRAKRQEERKQFQKEREQRRAAESNRVSQARKPVKVKKEAGK